MSESETVEPADQEVKEHNPKKRVRHRKRQLCENILKQMEFYFSDANVTKDRFLGDMIKNDPYVPLETFLKFNKIRAMTQDINDIAKAMKNSTILELSEDRLKVRRKCPVLPYDADQRTIYVESIPVTASREWLNRVFSDYGQVAYISLPRFKNSQKIKVRRKCPVLPYDADQRTIYVESIPVTASREWLNRVFSDYGQVAYISLPRFKNSQKIKGFGFIEFEKPEDAQKCLNTFTKMGCKLPICMPPEELSSIKMFSIEEVEEPHEKEEKEEPPKKKEKEEEPPKKKKKKDKKKNLELKLDAEADGDKLNTPSTPTPTEENKSISSTVEEGKTTDAESKDELTSQDESKNNTEAPRKKKKTRKRTAKERNKSKNSLGPNEAPKAALWGLQVLSKMEWKTLRNKYLNLQRKYMKELKANLQSKRHAYSSIPAPAVANAEGTSAINPANANAKPPLQRIPGAFVKEVLSEPCLDVRLLKRTIKTNIHAQHVDVKEGQTEVFIRFDSAKAASEYCANASNRAHVLSGGEEDEQWTRAVSARSCRRARGRDRLLAKQGEGIANDTPSDPTPTHTHIRFDEE